MNNTTHGGIKTRKELTQPDEKSIKSKSLILRLTEKENSILDCKSRITGTTKSDIIRDSIRSFWPGDFDPDQLLESYVNADADGKESILHLLTDFFHSAGYPHRKMTNEELSKGMTTLSKTKTPLLEEDHLQVNTVGLTIANYFHPHMVETKCGTQRTPYEQFSDKPLLYDAIRRWLDLGKKPSSSGLRRILRTRDGVRSVVNFKPAIAQYIYQNYCPENGAALDPCAGYGGRLTGCISTNKNIHYHGIDPHGRTAIGNVRLASQYANDWRFGFKFDLGCAEDIMPTLPCMAYDLVFTSPPFFNTEKYSNESSQSWVRYPTYDEWKCSFLAKIIQESRRVLKSGGVLILNVKNYKRMAIADDTVDLASQNGLELVKTYQMRLPNSDYQLTEVSKWHTEPIFVFKVI